MSEREIAEKKVKPRLFEMGFAEDQISDYDSVFVQFGTNTGRVDFVGYYLKGDQKLPFLVVEVKASLSSTDQIQAESYAQRLDAPFFAVTDGKDWHWFLTGNGQSNSIRLRDCPLPLLFKRDSLPQIAINHRKDLKELISLYEDKLSHDVKKCPVDYKNCSYMERPYVECEGCLVWNTTWLNWTLDQLSKLYANFQKMSAAHLVAILGSQDVLWSVYPQNRRIISEWIEDNVAETKNTLAYLLDETVPIEDRFDNLVSGNYHIPGIGPFLATMLIAGIKRENYTVISNMNLQGIKRLGLIELQPSNVTGIDYVNFNKIMLKLSETFTDKFAFGKTILVHDFTLLVGNYLDTGRWRG